MTSKRKRLLFLGIAAMAICHVAVAQDRAFSDLGGHDHGKTAAHKHVQLAPSYAWRVLAPLGLHEPATIDTAEYNYQRQAIPSMESDAWTTTGNMAAEGINEIWAQRPAVSDFFFRDAKMAWIPSAATQKFYNTRIPMTLLSFNTAGGRDNAQERLKGVFSGNVNKSTQFGANVDYLYSKGSYANQAAKGLIWGGSGSYMGDRFELQGFYNHFNMVNKENGGITNDLYITDPAELQGGVTSINAKSIPTRLSNAHSRIAGGELYLNSRYKVGYWHTEQVDDTTEHRTYIPVMSFIWTLNLNHGRHMFLDTAPGETANFFEHTYLSGKETRDVTRFTTLSNTFGVSMLEGFHKYAKFGMAAYVTHELQRFTQTGDSLNIPVADLDVWPTGITKFLPRETRNLLRVGGQITKQHGSVLTYKAGIEFGLVGPAAGDVNANGSVTTRIPLPFDTISVSAYGEFDNRHAPYLMNNYVSNHFIWQNDFGKTRRYKVGGSVEVPRTSTRISAGLENIDKLLYWNEMCLPTQYDGNVQVFHARIEQELSVGALHWNNSITYQTTSKSEVLPLPALTIYTNLYAKFHIATLKVQLGIDCDYYTKFYAPLYQPATMTFHVQREAKIGNYPFMNLYANMKLGKARFYVMMSHINQGWTGKNYFSMAGYPLNPRRFQMGVAVDFAN